VSYRGLLRSANSGKRPSPELTKPAKGLMSPMSVPRRVIFDNKSRLFLPDQPNALPPTGPVTGEPRVRVEFISRIYRIFFRLFIFPAKTRLPPNLSTHTLAGSTGMSPAYT
jgi:hypothetical protein